MRAEEVMARNPYCCTSPSTIQRAAMLMKEHDLGFLPVVDEGGKLIGVITDRDICLNVTAGCHDPAHTRVHEHMTRNVVFCRAADDASSILNLMAENQIRRVPVLDQHDRVIGVVTLRDLMARNAASATEIRNVLKKITAEKPEPLAHVAGRTA